MLWNHWFSKSSIYITKQSLTRKLPGSNALLKKEKDAFYSVWALSSIQLSLQYIDIPTQGTRHFKLNNSSSRIHERFRKYLFQNDFWHQDNLYNMNFLVWGRTRIAALYWQTYFRFLSRNFNLLVFLKTIDTEIEPGQIWSLRRVQIFSMTTPENWKEKMLKKIQV